MSQGTDPDIARRRRASLSLLASGVGSTAVMIFMLIRDKHPVGFLYLAAGLVTAGYATFIVLNWPRGQQRPGGAAGLDQRDDGDDGTATPAADQWPALSLVARLMPSSAGRRWLAEANSLLSEVAPDRRGDAVRSYLRSAPRLVLTMWARRVSRRARFGPRRPG